MPLRSVKMNRFILGFHRRVWCPKWTPLSSSCFMVTTAMAEAHSFARRVAATRFLRQGRLSLAPDALRGRAQAVGDRRDRAASRRRDPKVTGEEGMRIRPGVRAVPASVRA